jgi:hypothetical protein
MEQTRKWKEETIDKTMNNRRVREDGLERIFKIIRDKECEEREVPRMSVTVN